MRQNLRTRLTTYDYEAVALQFAQQPQKSCFQNKISEQRRHSHVLVQFIIEQSKNKTQYLEALIALWPRKMKIDCSRQTWTERRQWDFSPVGAKNLNISCLECSLFSRVFKKWSDI